MPPRGEGRVRGIMDSPLIFDIKRHALEDGPGIRTTVFFKGCNLRCVWCHNPESIDPAAEIGFYPSRCINCGDCERVCARSACTLSNPDRIERDKCNRCGDCVKACPALGLRLIGRYYPVGELIDIVLRDRVYYEVSGGGVTFSGGEPTLHMNYLSSVLCRLKKLGIHTAIQTNGYFEWARFEAELLDTVDLVMFDLKLAESEEHQRYTGQPNQLILENLGHLVRQKKVKLIPRIPHIPQITANKDNLEKLGSILQRFGVNAAILPYNPLGVSKWKTIGKKAPAPDQFPLDMYPN